MINHLLHLRKMEEGLMHTSVLGLFHHYQVSLEFGKKKYVKELKEPEATIKLTSPWLLAKQSFRITSRLINANVTEHFTLFICLKQLCDSLPVQLSTVQVSL